MSCYSCGSSFGMFKKEQGCKNCGYAFCKDCLTKKAAIPKMNNEKHKVCLKCYKVLTGQVQPETKPAQYSPPQAYKKRMAKLENKSTVHHADKMQNIKPSSARHRGLSKEDRALDERLQRLKEDRGGSEVKNIPSVKEMETRLEKLKNKPDAVPPPSEQDMATRLAKLKGQDPANVSKPHVFAVDRRVPTQQVDDLLQEICDEVEIDSHGLDHASDVQNRLDQYRGDASSTPGDLTNNLNTPNSKDYTKNIPQVDSEFQSVSGEEVGWSEMNRLVQQVAGELELDAQKALVGLRKDQQLWDRLSKLKKKRRSSSTDQDPETSQGAQNIGSGLPSAEHAPDADDDTEEDEEEACKSIIKQLLEESRLEEQLEEEEATGKKMDRVPNIYADTGPSHKSEERGSDDELPWCCICNGDATLRCLGCDEDLYCKRCYKEGHDREDYADHQTKPYKSTQKKKR